MDTPIVCLHCGARGAVNRVTASLRCACGSTDLDLDYGQQVRTAKPVGPGSGWGPHTHSPTEGWDEYAGPTPGRNPLTRAPVNDSMVCPACHGAKWDPLDSTVLCRECNGLGKVSPTTGQPAVQSWDATTQEVRPGGAGWHASLQGIRTEAGRPAADGRVTPQEVIRSSTPGFGERGMEPAPQGEFNHEDAATYYPRMPNVSPHVHTRPEKDYDAPVSKPYQLDQAMCPNCGHSPTELRKDKSEDAWWHCPSCGPLANIDKSPEVNPFSPGPGFKPDRSMKTGARMPFTRKTGKLLKIAQSVADANGGLSASEVLSVARATVALQNKAQA